MRKRLFLIGALSISIVGNTIVLGQVGNISGVVIDKTTKQPLVGANVVVLGTQMGAMADAEGRFVIRNVKVGEYSVQASMMGYRPQIFTKVYVAKNRTRQLTFELEQTVVKLRAITVTPDYFPKEKDTSVSSRSLNYYEVRWDPEGYNVQRVFASLPGVTTAEDYSAQIIVRGGSPDENLVIVDNVELNNPIHFGDFGGAGGVESILNTELIRSIDFSSGGFPAKYGDKLSSFMDVKLREGNREKFQSMFDFNMAGIGFSFEGPLLKQGSYLFAYRHSYIELLDKVVDIGNVIPTYYDLQGKISFDISKDHKLWFFGIKGDDKMTVPRGDEFDLIYDMIWRSSQNVLGMNWRYLFSSKGFSLLTLSTTTNWWDFHSRDDFSIRVTDTDYTSKANVTYRISPPLRLEVGATYKYLNLDHYFYESTDTTDKGIVIPGEKIIKRRASFKAASYLHVVWRPWYFFSLKLGIRYDYFALNKEAPVSPRVGVTFHFSTKTAINFAYGEFYQSPHYEQLLRNTLTSNHATHYIAGVEHLLRGDMKITLEIYEKRLDNLVAPVAEGSRELNNSGSGFSRGVELFIHKKLSRKLYGKVSYTYSISKRKDYRGEHYFDWDQRHIFTIIGGYKFSDKFEISFKWRYASGRPYTPLIGRFQDPVSGRWYRIDGEVNSARYPAYHRLDLQIAHHYVFKNWSITAYFNLQNSYNRKNIFAYYWNDDFTQRKAFYQFTLMPVGGFTIEF